MNQKESRYAIVKAILPDFLIIPSYHLPIVIKFNIQLLFFNYNIELPASVKEFLRP